MTRALRGAFGGNGVYTGELGKHTSGKKQGAYLLLYWLGEVRSGELRLPLAPLTLLICFAVAFINAF
jgi:hypothetical protein